MENTYEELVDDIIYVEEEPNLTNSTYTFIEFNENETESQEEPFVVVPHHLQQKQTILAKDYICGSCDESFVFRSELDTHLQAKHPDIFNVINSYKKNESTSKEKIDVVIPKNASNTTSSNKVTSIERSWFTCKCGEKFSKFLELEQHVEMEHTDEFQIVSETGGEDTGVMDDFESGPETRNLIEECDIVKNDAEIMIVKQLPNESQIEMIDDGITSFVTIDELKAKRIKRTIRVRGVHSCKHCEEKFQLKTNYLDHMREKHPDNPEFICEVCSKGFFDQHQLKKHKTIHNSKRFVCDMCAKGFSTKSKLTVHLDVHFRRNTVDCEICGKTFANKSGYRVHLKKHLGMWDKNIICEVCNARFRYQYNLDMHMKIHTGQKDFFCDICSKGFALQRHLQAHIDSHNGLRKYDCETCGQKFIRRQTWRRHLLTHTGEKAYKCQICNAAYVDRRSLRKHLEKIHPDSNIEAFAKPLHAVPVIVEERSVTLITEMPL